MSKDTQNKGLITAIVFAAVVVSASLVFFAIQMQGNVIPGESNEDSFVAKVAQKIEDDKQNALRDAQDVQRKSEEASAKNVRPVSKDKDHIRGNKDAEISLIEYSDFECPFCKRFHPTAQQVVDDYDGKVNWVYRHFPLGFHDPLATKEALGSECANELGGNEKFWEFTDLVYERTTSNGRGLELEDLNTMAVEIGLDRASFSECLDSEKYLSHVQQDIKEGAQAGVTGTPGNIVINNKTGDVRLILGAQPVSAVKQVIDELLK